MCVIKTAAFPKPDIQPGCTVSVQQEVVDWMDGLSALRMLRLCQPSWNSQVLTNVPEHSRGSLDICWRKCMNTKWELFSLSWGAYLPAREIKSVLLTSIHSLCGARGFHFSLFMGHAVCMGLQPWLQRQRAQSGNWLRGASEFLSGRKYEPYVLVGSMLAGTLACTTAGSKDVRPGTSITNLLWGMQVRAEPTQRKKTQETALSPTWFPLLLTVVS